MQMLYFERSMVHSMIYMLHYTLYNAMYVLYTAYMLYMNDLAMTIDTYERKVYDYTSHSFLNKKLHIIRNGII